MKFALSFTTLIASALLASNVEARWSAKPGLSWDYLIGAGSGVIKSSDKQVVTIDLEEAEHLSSYLHGKGQNVICYFSGGTMQEARHVDYQDYVKAGVQITSKSNYDNHYIDIRKKDKLYPLINKRMERAVRFGCDGVEVDSIAIYLHVDGFVKDDTITFGKWVSELAHSHGLAIGLKNAAGCADKLEPYFDFAVVESCAESPNVCRLFTPFINHGKAVFTVHYGNRLYKLGSNPQAKLSQELGGLGFTCAFDDHQNVHHNSNNFDCSKGNYSSDSGSKPVKASTTTTSKPATTKTTTVNSTSTNSAKSNPINNPKPVIPNPLNPTSKSVDPSNPNANPVPGNLTNSTQPLTNATQPLTNATQPITNATQPITNNTQPITNANKEVGKGVGNNNSNKTEREGSSGIGTAVAVVAAGGGIAAAAVAGFVFLKKHKKFSKDDELNFA